MRNPFVFAAFPSWRRVFQDQSKEAQRAVYQDLAFRAHFREDLKKPQTFGNWTRVRVHEVKSAALKPFEGQSVDAIARTAWRMLVSRRHLLEWRASSLSRSSTDMESNWRNMWFAPALAVGTAERSPALPGVPSMVEAGLKDASYNFWVGLFVAARTPRPIVERLHGETVKALALPDVKERLERLGAAPMAMAQPAFERFLEAGGAAGRQVPVGRYSDQQLSEQRHQPHVPAHAVSDGVASPARAEHVPF